MWNVIEDFSYIFFTFALHLYAKTCTIINLPACNKLKQKYKNRK